MRNSDSECEKAHPIAVKQVPVQKRPCSLLSAVLFWERWHSVQVERQQGCSYILESGRHSLLPSSVAKDPRILKRVHLFTMVIPLLGISPKGTMNSAVQRFLCKHVHRNVIYKGGNLEAVWTHSDGEWVIHLLAFSLALQSICEGRMLSHKGTSWSKLNEEAGRVTAWSGGRKGVERKSQGPKWRWDMLGERAHSSLSQWVDCSGNRCQTLSLGLDLEKEFQVWVDWGKGRAADIGEAFPPSDRHSATCPGSTQLPQTGFASGTPPPPGHSPLPWELLSHPLFSVYMKDWHENQTKHSGYPTLKEKKVHMTKTF